MSAIAMTFNELTDHQRRLLGDASLLLLAIDEDEAAIKRLCDRMYFSEDGASDLLDVVSFQLDQFLDHAAELKDLDRVNERLTAAQKSIVSAAQTIRRRRDNLEEA